MKKVKHSELSNQGCSCGCGEMVKQNLINKKGPGIPVKRFHCFQISVAKTQNPIRTAREVRHDPSLQGKHRRDKGIPVRQTLRT